MHTHLGMMKTIAICLLVIVAVYAPLGARLLLRCLDLVATVCFVSWFSRAIGGVLCSCVSMCACTSNAQLYGLKNTNVQTAPGNAAHYVQWAPNTVPTSGNGIAGFEFEFYAEAANDVHVIFSCAKEKRPRQAIEVVLGGWGNRRSVIRSGAQGQELAKADNHGVCSANGARRYNVT